MTEEQFARLVEAFNEEKDRVENKHDEVDHDEIDHDEVDHDETEHDDTEHDQSESDVAEPDSSDKDEEDQESEMIVTDLTGEYIMHLDLRLENVGPGKHEVHATGYQT